MKLYEYEGKAMLKSRGIRVPAGLVMTASGTAAVINRDAVNRRGIKGYAVKAQVLAGGRGKAGGVKFAAGYQKAKEAARQMIGSRLATAQNPDGEKVAKVLVEEKISSKREFYFSFVIDRDLGQPVWIVSPEGGAEIEKMAEENPGKIRKIVIDPLAGLQSFQVRSAADFLGLKTAITEFESLTSKLFQIFQERDLLLLEINPLALTSDDRFVCLDVKMVVDDYALFRHPDFLEQKRSRETGAKEEILKRAGINFNAVAEGAGIGMFSNGAGFGFDMLDRFWEMGVKLIYFLDLGGGIGPEKIEAALNFMAEEADTKIIFGNIYCGLVSGGEIADAVWAAFGGRHAGKPVVLRLTGKKAKQTIKNIVRRNIPGIRAYETVEEALVCVKELGGNNDD